MDCMPFANIIRAIFDRIAITLSLYSEPSFGDNTPFAGDIN